jgi:hypothetical protein
MISPSSTLPPRSEPPGSITLRAQRGLASELIFLGSSYIVTVIVGSMFIAACGPGCCYVFYSIVAGISGILMLRRPFVSRCICLGALLLALLGMWHEKEVRETWGQRALHHQLEILQHELQKTQIK